MNGEEPALRSAPEDFRNRYPCFGEQDELAQEIFQVVAADDEQSSVSWIVPGSPTVRNSAVEARSLGGQPATLE